MSSALTVRNSVLKLSVPPGCALRTRYETGFPKASNSSMPSTCDESPESSVSVTRSASMSWRSSLTFVASLGFCAIMTNASPSWHRAILMVRSLAGSLVLFAQTAKSCSMRLLVSSSSRSIWRRGPVPTVSSASVFTMPRA